MRAFPNSSIRPPRPSPRLEVLEDRTVPSIYAINTTADTFDGGMPGDPDGPDGLLSLREAIMVTGLNPGHDTITFSIPGAGPHKIAVGPAILPTIGGQVTIDGYTQPGASQNSLTSGTNAVLQIELDLSALPANSYGLRVNTAGSGSIIRGLVINRGPAAIARGIWLERSDNNRIEGNFLGTDTAGSSLPGGTPNLTVPGAGPPYGVYVDRGTGNVIGTDGNGADDLAERNLISGWNWGVVLLGDSNTVVAGNLIGTDRTGTAALPNLFGIGALVSSHDVRVGTDGNGVGDTAERNVVSGNRFGILLAGGDPAPAAYNYLIAGNYVGTDAAGAQPLGNLYAGVAVGIASYDVQIGGPDQALRNVIAFNGSQPGNGPGVWLADFRGAPDRVRVQGNSIHDNHGLGIDLGGDFPVAGPDGVTPNDAGDGDGSGRPNQLQNFPVLTGALAGPTTAVLGTLNSSAGATFTLDFYASTAADPSGHGEGERYLGSQTVTTDIAGNATFAALLANATAAGEFITATATDAIGNTSEFSLAVAAQAGGLPQAPTIVVFDAAGGGAFTVSVNGAALPAFTPAGTVSLLGSAGDDAFTINATPAGGLTVDGRDGSDAYAVQLGALASLVTVTDGGVSGSDALTVNGTADAENITKVTLGSGKREVRRTVPTAEAVDAWGVELATIDGGGGNDTITDPGEGTTILGGPGDDTIVINATSGSGVLADGGEGSDTYMVIAGSLFGPVTIADSGAAGADALTFVGTPDADDIQQHGNQIVLGGQIVMFSSALEALTVDGGGGDDQFTVQGTPTVVAQTQGIADLSVRGTEGNDLLVLLPPSLWSGEVVAWLNGRAVAAFPPGSRIVAHGLGGNDILIAIAVSRPVLLVGGLGDDLIKGGSGDDTLVGGDGDDLLVGAAGRDLLIGGKGRDRIVGNSDDDLLVSGWTAFDANEAALAAVLAEWSSSRSYSQRVANLSGAAGGANGGYFLQPNVTVFDDGVRDVLTGDAGRDWFLLNLDGEGDADKDKVTDLGAAEFASDLDWILGGP